MSVRFFSAIYPLLEPVQYLMLNPAYSVSTQLYPLGKLTGCFEPGHMLRRVENKILELSLRKYPHHKNSRIGEHRDAPVVTNPEV